MSSAVYYKFKSQRNESRIAIDGTGISVLDLKREIIQANDLGKAMDIDLQVFEPKGEQGVSRLLSPKSSALLPTDSIEYPDDNLIPRSSSVIVKRVPLPRGAKSKFPLYLSGATKPAALSSDVNRRQPPISATWTGRGYGGFSKRFDGKDEPKEIVVRTLRFCL
jgi:protein MPE1